MSCTATSLLGHAEFVEHRTQHGQGITTGEDVSIDPSGITELR
jgi:hypothetical protein